MKALNKILSNSSRLILVLILLSFFWKVFLLNKVPLPGGFITGVYYPWLDYKWGYEVGVPVENPITADVVSFTYPMQTFAIEQLKAGNAPLWNPFILAGAPLLANFQSAPFAITNFVYWLFDTLNAWTARIVLQHLFAGFGMYIFLRCLKVSKSGSILGGVLYAFSGFNTIWSQWNTHVLTASFIPMLLLLIDKWLSTGKSKYVLMFAVAIFLQIISGYPQIVIYTALAMFIWWLVNYLIFFKRHDYSKTLILAFFGILGIGLAGLQVMPTAELLSTSQREAEELEYEMAFLPWEKVITFIAPDYYGNHASYNYWGPQDYTSNTGYVTVTGLLLAGTAVLSLVKNNKHVLILLTIGVTGLLLSFPTFISLTMWEAGFLGLQAASAHRALILWTFAVSALAAFGLDALTSASNLSRKISISVVFIIFTIFIINLPHGLDTKGIEMSTVAKRNLVLPLLSFISVSLIMLLRKYIHRYLLLFIILLIAVGELFWFWNKFTPFSYKHLVYPPTPITDFLKRQEMPFRTTGNNVIPINFRMAYGIETLEGYDAIYPDAISQFISAINDESGIGAFSSRRYAIINDTRDTMLSMANVKYVIALTKDKDIYDESRYKVAFEDKSVIVLEDTLALPRAKLFYDWEIISDDIHALRTIADEHFPYLQKVILSENLSIGKQNEAGQGEVEYLKYKANESIISVKSNHPGVLFVSDLYYPGWKAYLGDNEVPILKANYAFRAIEIPAGEHLVTFMYTPESFNNGLVLSLVSLVILLGSYLVLRYTYER